MARKIALVYDSIYPYLKGGGEKRYYEIARHLHDAGNEVHWYGMKFWKGKNIIFRDGIYLHGIMPAMPLYTKSGRRSIKQALLFGVSCLKLVNQDFDSIDCCGFPYFSLISCKIVCFLKNKKLVSTWHEVWGISYWKKYLGNLWLFGYLTEKFAMHLPDKIIAVSGQTARSIKKELHFIKPIKIIPNGINFNEIKQIKGSKLTSDIIYVGRLMDFKRVDLLIKSLAILKKDKPDIRCLVIGDGPEKQSLKLLAKNLNLQNNIKFFRFLKSHSTLYSLMKSSKVLALPSTREGFGIVVLEANACGIQVVTVDHPNNAAKDLIAEGKNGYISELNEKDLANKIFKTLSRKEMHAKTTSMLNAQKYDWHIIASSFAKASLI